MPRGAPRFVFHWRQSPCILLSPMRAPVIPLCAVALAVTVVVPDSAAPVVPGQVKTVTVKSEALTSVVLDFDTGIR